MKVEILCVSLRELDKRINMSETDNPAIEVPPYHEIYTPRLKLRTLRVSDAERLMPILSSKEVMQWTVDLIIVASLDRDNR